MGSVGAVVAGSVVGGLIQSKGAKSAANTQAAAMDRAGDRTAQAAAEAKTEILDRMAPALIDYNRGISQSIDQIKQGGQNVISILNGTTQNAKNILSTAGADAEKIMMGSQAEIQGVPRQQFERQYRQISQLPPDQRGQALSNMTQAINQGQYQGYQGAQQAIGQGGTQAAAQLERGFGTGRQDIQKGLSGAIGRLNVGQDLIDRYGGQALEGFRPYSTAGKSAMEREAAFSGAMGADAQKQAYQDFIESPGQKFIREEQEKALLRSSAAIGGLGGGQVRSALQEQAMGRAATLQQQHLENLRSISGRGQQAAGSEAGILGQIATGKTGLLSQEAGLTTQAAQQQAQMAQALGISQADLSRMTADQIAGLAERSGLNLSNLTSQQGTQQALMEQGRGQAIAAQTGATAANVAGLTESQAVGNLNTQQNISQTLANLATQKGTDLARIDVGMGQAQAAGQQAQANIFGGMAQGLGNIAAYGLATRPQAQPRPVQPRGYWG